MHDQASPPSRGTQTPTDPADVDAYLAPGDDRRVLVYLFRLPFDCPLRDRDSWTVALEGDLGDAWDVEYFAFATEEMKAVNPYPMNLREPQASVMFWRPDRDSESPLMDTEALDKVASVVFGDRHLPSASTPPQGPALFDTVVEVVTQAARSDVDPQDWPLVSIGFERALRSVNEILAALGSATGDLTYRPLAVEELDPFALVSSRPVDLVQIDSEEVEASLPRPTAMYLDPIVYLLNPSLGVHIPGAPLTTNDRARVNDFISAGRRAHPFLTYQRLVRKARRARETGDYAVTAIMAAASGEVLLNLILRGMLVEEGRADQIPVLFDDPRGGFTARLRREYSGRLGHKWDLDDPATAIGHWAIGTHNLRHRVVHAGYEPTPAEASEAIHGSEVLEDFVIARIVEKRFVYPKVALSLIGEQGFAGRNLLNARLAKVVAAEAPVLADFWLSMAGEGSVEATPTT